MSKPTEEDIPRLVRELIRAQTHLRRIYRASTSPGTVELEVSAALAALDVCFEDLKLPRP